MIVEIEIRGKVELGEFLVFSPGCLHQPIASYPINSPYPLSTDNINFNSEALEYKTCTPLQNQPDKFFSQNELESQPIEVTYIYIYILHDFLVSSGSTPLFNKYYGSLDRFTVPISTQPSITKPSFIRVEQDDGVAIYSYTRIGLFTHKIKYYQNGSVYSSKVMPAKPNYMSFVTGYDLDDRKLPPNYPVIIPSKTETVKIGYFYRDDLEPIPNLKSINWFTCQCNLVEGQQFKLPINNCVMGTFNCDSLAVIAALQAVPTPVNSYPYQVYLESNLPNLFSEWTEIYNASLSPPAPPSHPFSVIIDTVYTEQIEHEPTLHVLGANNNAWNNRPISTTDLNVDLTHPMFIVDDVRSYKWHIELQPDGSRGNLMTDSIRLINVEAALNAFKWAYDDADPTVPRVANLGHMIEMIASLLGYRPQSDGTFDSEAEKNRVKRVINSKQQIDKSKIGVNNFGIAGMLLKRISNRFEGKKIVSDQCVIVRDIPQILGEYQDQINLALGLQESSAIEINNEAGTARYNNQLEVLIELVNIAKANQEMLRAALTSSLVTQGQTSEIIGGIGLPSVTKTFTVKIEGKNKQLPYKGISPHRSLSQEIATASYNAGLATGQLL